MSKRLSSNESTELLQMLTNKVRVVTPGQLVAANSLWSQRRVNRLVNAGLLAMTNLTVAVLDAGGEPYASWQPSQPMPNAGAISYLGRCRIHETPTENVQVVWATSNAVKTVGGVGGKLRQPWQIQHDLGVASVYLHYRNHYPDLALRWIGEDIYRRDLVRQSREKVADAFLMTATGRIERAIELVGDYSTARLREFHDYWSRRHVAYEWR